MLRTVPWQVSESRLARIEKLAMDTSEFKVHFGGIARTIVYEDAAGTIVFCFDVKPQKNPQTGNWTMVLEPRPEPNPDRVKQAFSRVRDYVASRGYDVVVWGIDD